MVGEGGAHTGGEKKQALYYVLVHNSSDKEIGLPSHLIVMCYSWLSGT